MLKILYQPLVIAIITLLTGILCLSLYVSSFQLRGSSEKVAVLKADVEKQQALADELAKKLEAAQHPFSKEELIRDQLLMQKPGEFVVQMPNLPVNDLDLGVTPQQTSPWQEWKKLLF